MHCPEYRGQVLQGRVTCVDQGAENGGEGEKLSKCAGWYLRVYALVWGRSTEHQAPNDCGAGQREARPSSQCKEVQQLHVVPACPH